MSISRTFPPINERECYLTDDIFKQSEEFSNYNMMEYKDNFLSDGNDLNLNPSNFTNCIDHNGKDSYEEYYEKNEPKYSTEPNESNESKHTIIEISQNASSDSFIFGKIENNKEILNEDSVTHKNKEMDLTSEEEKKRMLYVSIYDYWMYGANLKEVFSLHFYEKSSSQ